MRDEVGKILDKMIVGATKKRFKNVGEILWLIQSTSKVKKRFISSSQIFQASTAELEKGELFQCSNGEFISSKSKCDHHDDCADSSDEQDCGK